MGEFGIGHPVLAEEDPIWCAGPGTTSTTCRRSGRRGPMSCARRHAHARDRAVSMQRKQQPLPGVLLVLDRERCGGTRWHAVRPHTPRRRRDGTRPHVVAAVFAR